MHERQGYCLNVCLATAILTLLDILYFVTLLIDIVNSNNNNAHVISHLKHRSSFCMRPVCMKRYLPRDLFYLLICLDQHCYWNPVYPVYLCSLCSTRRPSRKLFPHILVKILSDMRTVTRNGVNLFITL